MYFDFDLLEYVMKHEGLMAGASEADWETLEELYAGGDYEAFRGFAESRSDCGARRCLDDMRREDYTRELIRRMNDERERIPDESEAIDWIIDYMRDDLSGHRSFSIGCLTRLLQTDESLRELIGRSSDFFKDEQDGDERLCFLADAFMAPRKDVFEVAGYRQAAEGGWPDGDPEALRPLGAFGSMEEAREELARHEDYEDGGERVRFAIVNYIMDSDGNHVMDDGRKVRPYGYSVTITRDDSRIGTWKGLMAL